MPKKRKRIGLALGSGGAKGLAHIGVIKALEQNNIPIDYIAGSSIGALVGAYYALYKDIDKLEKLALSNSWRTSLKIFDPSLKAMKSSLISGRKIENLFKEWFKNKTFKDTQIPFVAVATNLIDGQEINITKGSLAQAVRGSISVPVVFQPIKYKGYILADGGLSNPLPGGTAKKMGADVVIAVNLDVGYFNNNFEKIKITLPAVSMRALNIMRYHLAKYSAKTADIILQPEIQEAVGLIGWKQFFNPAKAEKIIQSGVETVNNNIAQIRKIALA